MQRSAATPTLPVSNKLSTRTADRTPGGAAPSRQDPGRLTGGAHRVRPVAVVGMVWLVLGPPPVVRADTPPGRWAATLPLAADERVTWSRRMESRTLMRVSALVVLLGLGMALAVEPLVLAVLMLAALMTLRAPCSVLRVAGRGGRAGTVRGGGSLRVAGEAGAAGGDAPARVVVTGPGEWGGWGYRASMGVPTAGASSPVTARRCSWISPNGRRFVVTVDDAETAVRLVNGLLVRQRA